MPLVFLPTLQTLQRPEVILLPLPLALEEKNWTCCQKLLTLLRIWNLWWFCIITNLFFHCQPLSTAWETCSNITHPYSSLSPFIPWAIVFHSSFFIYAAFNHLQMLSNGHYDGHYGKGIFQVTDMETNKIFLVHVFEESTLLLEWSIYF